VVDEASAHPACERGGELETGGVDRDRQGGAAPAVVTTRVCMPGMIAYASVPRTKIGANCCGRWSAKELPQSLVHVSDDPVVPQRYRAERVVAGDGAVLWVVVDDSACTLKRAGYLAGRTTPAC
jgi:hypothetical protein